MRAVELTAVVVLFVVFLLMVGFSSSEIRDDEIAVDEIFECYDVSRKVRQCFSFDGELCFTVDEFENVSPCEEFDRERSELY